MDTRYVQHMSGQGEIFKILNLATNHCASPFSYWTTERGYLLPHSEFVRCEPPESWKNVTAECEIETEFGQIQHGDISRYCHTSHGEGYRFKKVEVTRIGAGVPPDCEKTWAFIIEKREP